MKKSCLVARKENVERELKLLLLPKDPNDEKSVIVEIRAGTGGDEAALFAGELFRMYSRYAETLGWKVEVLESSPVLAGRPERNCRRYSGLQSLFQAEI